MKKEQIIDEVETIVCAHVGIERDQMLEKTKKGACVKARHLSIYILHSMFNLSIRDLSKRYECSIRQVFKINQHVVDYVAYNSHYREFYSSIIDDVSNKIII